MKNIQHSRLSIL